MEDIKSIPWLNFTAKYCGSNIKLLCFDLWRNLADSKIKAFLFEIINEIAPRIWRYLSHMRGAIFYLSSFLSSDKWWEGHPLQLLPQPLHPSHLPLFFFLRFTMDITASTAQAATMHDIIIVGHINFLSCKKWR